MDTMLIITEETTVLILYLNQHLVDVWVVSHRNTAQARGKKLLYVLPKAINWMLHLMHCSSNTC